MGQILTNLYDFQCYFGLLIDGVLTEILEPDGWNSIQLHSPRNKDYYGFTADFIEDNLGMLFTYAKGATYPGQKNITGGAEILYNLYETIGNEALVIFQFGQKVGQQFNPLYQGKVNLNVYYRDFGGVSTSVEKMPFQATFLARKGAPVTINNFQTFDLEKLTPITTWQLRLHSQALQETSQGTVTTVQDSNLLLFSAHPSSYVTMQPDTSNQTISELNTFISAPLGLIDETATPIITEELFQFQAQFAGSTNVQFSGSINAYFFLWGNVGPAPGHAPIVNHWAWTIAPRMIIQRLVAGAYVTISDVTDSSQALFYDPNSYPDNIVYPAIDPHLFSGIDATDYDKLVGVNYTWTNSPAFQGISLLPLDRVYINLDFQWSNPGGLGVTNLTQMVISKAVDVLTITQVTLAPSTTANGFRVLDVLNQMMECITGQQNAVISDFFSPGGAGYNYMLLNGFSIRGYGGQAYSFRKDLESLISDLQAVFCLGYGFSTINGIEYLRIDTVDKFFNPNNIILKIGNSFEWKDGHGSEWIYNEVQLGYSRYAKDELQMLEAFCTDASYLFQVSRTHTNTLQKTTALVADGNTLEFARRSQFLQNASNDNTFDDDIFLIALTNGNTFSSVALSFVGAAFLGPSGGNLSIIFPENFSLIPGDRVSVTSGPYAGFTFTVFAQLVGYPTITGQDGYSFTDSVPVGTIASTCNITVIPCAPNVVFAEANEPFAICENVLDPGSIYNGRISNKHVLFNWLPILSISLYFAQANNPDLNVAQIHTTQTKNNRLFTTQFLPTEPYKSYAGELVLQEFANVNNTDYLQNAAVFTPKGGECKAYVGWNEYAILKAALSQETGNPSLDGGGIVVNDDLGNFWFCHVMDVSYNPVEQIAQFQLQKVRQYFPTAGEIPE